MTGAKINRAQYAEFHCFELINENTERLAESMKTTHIAFCPFHTYERRIINTRRLFIVCT